MIAIVLSQFNQEVTNGLLNGCLASLETGGFNDERVDVHKVPGAFELPAKVKFLAAYAEIGDAYVEKLEMIIESNKLREFDRFEY